MNPCSPSHPGHTLSCSADALGALEDMLKLSLMWSSSQFSINHTLGF